MASVDRPTAPHLTIYRPQNSSVLSITHRFTGVGLYFGLVLIMVWLYSAAYAPAFYGTLHSLLASWFGQFCLFGWTVCFYYHLGNGIRHLCWDAGYGFSIPAMTRSGWMMLGFCVGMTVLTWGIAYSIAG